MDLTTEHWNRIEPIIFSVKPSKDSRGREERGAREVLNGILWILRSGKGAQIMAIADAAGIPVSAHIESASPHVVRKTFSASYNSVAQLSYFGFFEIAFNGSMKIRKMLLTNQDEFPCLHRIFREELRMESLATQRYSFRKRYLNRRSPIR